MKRLLFSLLATIILLSQSVSLVAALSLQSIGVSTVGGQSISSWTYQGTNPVFSGTAAPSATVSIDINGTVGTATADSSGSWSYTPTTLTTSGSFPVTITEGSETKSFTLTMTTPASSTAATSTSSGSVSLPDELPQTGAAEETMMLIGGGIGLMLAGIFFYWKVVPKLLFEEVAVTDIEKQR